MNLNEMFFTNLNNELITRSEKIYHIFTIQPLIYEFGQYGCPYSRNFDVNERNMTDFIRANKSNQM